MGILSTTAFALLISLALVAGVLFVIALVARSYFKKKHALEFSLSKKVLQIRMPKEGAKQEEEEKGGKGDFQELVAVAESLYASLGAIKPRQGLKSFFVGREDELAFEIVAIEGLIKFYAVIPAHLQNIFEQQLLAQYPSAEVTEVADYNLFRPKDAVVAAPIRPSKHWVFPLKTYKKMDSDPLNSLTNTLSKVEKNQGVLVQLVVRTANPSWRQKGQKLARAMQQGKNLSEAMKAAGIAGSAEKLFGVAGGIGKTAQSAVTGKKEEAPKEKYQLSPLEQELLKSVEEKGSKAGFETNIRVVASAATADIAQMLLFNTINAFSQYTGPESGTQLIEIKRHNKVRTIENAIHRQFYDKYKTILNAEELASIFHLPSSVTETPNIDWLKSRSAPPPADLPQEGILLGESNYRGIKREIRMLPEDRRRHTYVIGMTGSGKTTLMKNMIKQDIINGEGCCFIDPHGDAIQDILECIPPERADDVVLFEPANTDRPVGLNMLEARSPEMRDFAVQEMIQIFYKLFPPEMIGPMFEHNMRNVMLTLMADLENPGTLAEIPRMFTDDKFAQTWIDKLDDPVVRAFWEKEMKQTSDFHKSEMLGYLISKVGRFVENTMMRNIIGQKRSGFDIRDIMDNRKILLVNLSKGQVGEVNSNLLGLIIVSKLQMAAMSRVDIVDEEKRADFFLYIDEFQNFITDSISTILAEARKYRLNLIMGHQYIAQLTQGGKTDVRDAIFGNVGTIVSFRVGVDDAETIAKQMAPVFNEYDVMNIEKTYAYIRLLIKNTAARPFNMRTHAPSEGDPKVADAIRQLAQLKYGKARATVEKDILDRTQLGVSIQKATEPGVEKSG